MNAHVPIPRTCECVTVCGKREFVDVIKNLQLESSFWIIQGSPMQLIARALREAFNHRGPELQPCRNAQEEACSGAES